MGKEAGGLLLVAYSVEEGEKWPIMCDGGGWRG